MIKVVLPLLRSTSIRAITIFPFVFFSDKNGLNNLTLVNHERIHIRQQLELLVIIFYLMYVIEYLVRRVKSNHNEAYRNLSFEKEAYYNERNFDYLSERKLFSFLKYY